MNALNTRVMLICSASLDWRLDCRLDCRLDWGLDGRPTWGGTINDCLLPQSRATHQADIASGRSPLTGGSGEPIVINLHIDAHPFPTPMRASA